MSLKIKFLFSFSQIEDYILAYDDEFCEHIPLHLHDFYKTLVNNTQLGRYFIL